MINIFILIVSNVVDWIIAYESYFSHCQETVHNPSLYNFQSENEVQRIWDNFSSCILLAHQGSYAYH
jgi:hypothetical protein